jgi:hypothetical protein
MIAPRERPTERNFIRTYQQEFTRRAKIWRPRVLIAAGT